VLASQPVLLALQVSKMPLQVKSFGAIKI